MRFVRALTSAASVLAVICAVAGPGSAAAPPDPALAALPAKMVAALVANDATAFRAVCAASTTVIDEFPPYSWSGPDTCARWSAAFKVFMGQVKMTDPKGTVAPHPFIDVTGNHAYVVAKVKWDATLSGKPISEEGTWTFVLAKSGAAWKITSIAWGTLHH
jgi:uncharacterized protein DUF4440